MSHVELPVVLSPTRAEQGLRCQRRHVLSDLLEKGKCKSPSAAFGSLMHGAVAVYWQTLLNNSDYLQVLNESRQELQNGYAHHMAGACSTNGHELALAESMLDVYTQRAELAGPYTALGGWRDMLIEQRIVLDVGDYKLSFQQDRSVIQPQTNWLLVVDLKTASRMDARWRKQWERSLQMKLYKWAALEWYDVPRVDVVIEGLMKGNKPKLEYVPLPEWSSAILREAVEAFKYVADGDRQLLESALDANGIVDMERFTALAVSETTPNYHDCDAYGYDCPFLPLCTTDPEYRAGLLKADYIDVPQDY